MTTQTATLSCSSTTLVAGGGLWASIPDASIRARIRSHERTYKEKLKRAKDLERLSLLKQDEAVAKAIDRGKDKRQVRKLKNRLSALRSRQRKEAEHALTQERVKSLEDQVLGFAKMIERLQRNIHDKETHTLAHSKSLLQNNGGGHLALRQHRMAARKQQACCVHRAGTRSSHTSRISAPLSEAVVATPQQGFQRNTAGDKEDDLSLLSDISHLFEGVAPRDFRPWTPPFSTPNATHSCAPCDATPKSANCPTKSRCQRDVLTSSLTVDSAVHSDTKATIPGHALISPGIALPSVPMRRNIRRTDKCVGTWMDHFNGGTRMLPGRRALSSVEKAVMVAAAAAHCMRTREGVGRSWVSMMRKQRHGRCAESRRCLFRAILMLCLLLWQQRNRLSK